MAFVPYGQEAVRGDTISAMLFFLVGYALASIGAWAVVTALEQAEGKGLSLDDYAGLGRKYPLLGIAMAVCMLSFTGIPPTLGFWGKLYLFRTAVEGGYASLALIGLLTSLVSAYYYLRVVVMMYFKPGEPQVAPGVWLTVVAGAAALAVVGLSLVPGLLLDLASQALPLL